MLCLLNSSDSTTACCSAAAAASSSLELRREFCSELWPDVPTDPARLLLLRPPPSPFPGSTIFLPDDDARPFLGLPRRPCRWSSRSSGATSRQPGVRSVHF